MSQFTRDSVIDVGHYVQQKVWFLPILKSLKAVSELALVLYTPNMFYLLQSGS